MCERASLVLASAACKSHIYTPSDGILPPSSHVIYIKARVSLHGNEHRHRGEPLKPRAMMYCSVRERAEACGVYRCTVWKRSLRKISSPRDNVPPSSTLIDTQRTSDTHIHGTCQIDRSTHTDTHTHTHTQTDRQRERERERE